MTRSIDTAFYALGFPANDDMVKQARDLRELNFGEHEGLHFDGLTQQEKEEISDPNYQAPGGENWDDVRQRTSNYFGSLTATNHMIFTHGGPLTALLYEFGVH